MDNNLHPKLRELKNSIEQSTATLSLRAVSRRRSNLIGNKIATSPSTDPRNDRGKELFNSRKLEISVVIPAYNESKRIPKTLKIINDFFSSSNYSYEIIVVDDGSLDDTKRSVEELGFKNVRVLGYKANRGKGYAVNFGVKNSVGKKVIFIDADNSTPFKQIEKLLEYSDDFEVVIGSRYLKNSNIKIKQPFTRRLAARFGNLLIRILLLPRLSDTQCGFKMFQQGAAQEIFARQTIWRWGFDIETLFIAKKLKYKIKEVPIDWYNDEGTKIQSPMVFLTTLSELMRIKVNSLKGIYNRREPKG